MKIRDDKANPPSTVGPPPPPPQGMPPSAAQVEQRTRIKLYESLTVLVDVLTVYVVRKIDQIS